MGRRTSYKQGASAKRVEAEDSEAPPAGPHTYEQEDELEADIELGPAVSLPEPPVRTAAPAGEDVKGRERGGNVPVLRSHPGGSSAADASERGDAKRHGRGGNVPLLPSHPGGSITADASERDEAKRRERGSNAPLLPAHQGGSADLSHASAVRLPAAWRPPRERYPRLSAVLRRRLPVVVWGRQYTWSQLRTDLTCGLTVGVVLIPQGIAYAVLAGMPPIYGLYSSLAPLPVYALTASTVHVSIGPFALISMLIADSVSTVVDINDEQAYVNAAVTLSLMVGLTHILMAAFGGDFIVSLLADCVLAGYTCAAAFLISGSQLKHALGLTVPRGTLFSTLSHIASHVAEINLVALCCCIGSLAGLLLIKKLNRRFCAKVFLPEQLIVIGIATLAAWASAAGGSHTEAPFPVVGTVPSGLPSLAAPVFSWDLAVALLKPALLVGVFAYLLTMSITRTFGLKYGYRADSNQELLALGCANLVGSFVSAYPVSGSLSRSALVASTGRNDCTPLHLVFTSLVVLLVLLLLTPAFSCMPYATLAAIVFMAVKQLFDFNRPRELFRVHRLDFVLWTVAFCSTLALGAQLGIAVSVVCSLLSILLQTLRPNFAVLGRIPGTSIYRDVRGSPDSKQPEGVVIFRFDSPLHFANADFFREACLKAIDCRGAKQPPLPPRGLLLGQAAAAKASAPGSSDTHATGNGAGGSADRCNAGGDAGVERLDSGKGRGNGHANGACSSCSRSGGRGEGVVNVGGGGGGGGGGGDGAHGANGANGVNGVHGDAANGVGGNSRLGMAAHVRELQVDTGDRITSEKSPAEATQRASGPQDAATQTPSAGGTPGFCREAPSSPVAFASREPTLSPTQPLAPASAPDLPSVLVLDLGGVNGIDTTGLRMLEDLHGELKSRGMRLVLSSCKCPVRKFLRAAHFVEKIGHLNFVSRLDDAVAVAVRMHFGQSIPTWISAQESTVCSQRNSHGESCIEASQA